MHDHDEHRTTAPRRDRELVDRLLAGDRAAFDRFFDENAEGLVRFAIVRLGGDEELAREVVQATLCRAIASIEGFRGESSLFTWLCTCCRYEMASERERRKRRARDVDLDSAEASVAVDRAGSSTDQALGREEKELVHRTLSELSEDQARVLAWRYLDGDSVEEIAERMSTTYKAAESKLSRARVAFRRRFRALSGDLGSWLQAHSRAGSKEAER